MNTLLQAGQFVLTEGLLLTLLFFLVAFAIALAQQSFGASLMRALGGAALGPGTVVAALAGAVTPFCSCSTVPVLAGLLSAGVRFGVCFTFLMASPVINEGVLLVLLRQQSLAQAALFLGVAFALSVGFGVLLDRLGMARHVKQGPADAGLDGAVRVGGTPARVPLTARLRFAARSAAHELRAAAPYLALGIVVGALIHGYVPQQALAQLQQALPAWAQVLALAVLGVPFYVSPAMVVPIGVALLDKGLGVGPVAAFLVSAAGTSVPEMIMLLRLFRAPLILWHVVSIVCAAVVIGLVLSPTPFTTP